MFLLFCPLAGFCETSSSSEQALRLLEDGRAYWTQGKLKQALDNFNTIVTGFSATDSVDDALLEIGRYYLEVEENQQEKARDSFDQVTKRFPQSNGAPGAYYYLGWLTFKKAKVSTEWDDALAQFNRVLRLYPRSEWIPKTLYAIGLVHKRAGRLAEALDANRHLSLEYPTSPVTASAQFQIGQDTALLGDFHLAMEEFQQVRNRFPDSEWAPRALDNITALYRLYGAGKPVFTMDPGYSAGRGDMLKDVRGILMTSDRTLWIASDKVKGVVALDREGKLGPSLTIEGVRSMSLSTQGYLVVAAKLAVRLGPKEMRTFSIPTGEPGISEPLEKVTAAAVTQEGSLLVADEKQKHVYRYDSQYKYKGTFPDGKERQVTRIVVDGQGGIIFLDREEKTVQFFDETGHLVRAVGPKGAGFEFKRPVDIAVDSFRNVYVADEEGSVYILSSQGQLLVTLTGEELKRPRALTVDPSGALLVYDERAENILRYR